MRQIELLQPRIILAMGRFAVQALLRSDEPIGKLRGRVHRYQGVPLVVTYHPAYLLRNLPDKARAWDDLCLAASVVAAGDGALNARGSCRLRRPALRPSSALRGRCQPAMVAWRARATVSWPAGASLRDGRAAADGGAVAERHRRHQHAVAADVHVGADHGAVLVGAVVVGGDAAGAEVDALAHRGVAQVGQVVGLGAARPAWSS